MVWTGWSVNIKKYLWCQGNRDMNIGIMQVHQCEQVLWFHGRDDLTLQKESLIKNLFAHSTL